MGDADAAQEEGDDVVDDVDDVDDVVVVDVMTMVRCPQKSQVLGVRNDKPTSSHHSNVTSKRGYLNDDAGGGHEWYVEC